MMGSKCVHLSSAQSAGIGFFGMSAREFNTLTETERKNKMMNMMYKPFIFNTMVEYRLKDNHARERIQRKATPRHSFARRVVRTK